MPHWLLVALGLNSASGTSYLAWSGVVGDAGLVGALLLNAWLRARKHNCHQHHCLRIGRFPVAAGRFVTCRRHHPDPAVRGGLSAHHIIAAHRAHAEALAVPEPVPAAPADGDLGRKLDVLHADLTDLAHTLRATLLAQHQGRRR